MQRLALILMLLAGCRFGLSAAATIPYPDLYCEPINVDAQICRSDYGGEWFCSIRRGQWFCTRYL